MRHPTNHRRAVVLLSEYNKRCYGSRPVDATMSGADDAPHPLDRYDEMRNAEQYARISVLRKQ